MSAIFQMLIKLIETIHRTLPEPAVSRRTLLLSAGLVWALAGVLLAARAMAWFLPAGSRAVVPGALALLAGLIKSRYIFSPLARRNVQRLLSLSPHKERICVFAFQAWRSYLLVAVMMGMGFALRLSPVPRIWLAVLYLAVGVGLFLSSFCYWPARSGRETISS